MGIPAYPGCGHLYVVQPPGNEESLCNSGYEVDVWHRPSSRGITSQTLPNSPGLFEYASE